MDAQARPLGSLPAEIKRAAAQADETSIGAAAPFFHLKQNLLTNLIP